MGGYITIGMIQVKKNERWELVDEFGFDEEWGFKHAGFEDFLNDIAEGRRIELDATLNMAGHRTGPALTRKSVPYMELLSSAKGTELYEHINHENPFVTLEDLRNLPWKHREKRYVYFSSPDEIAADELDRCLIHNQAELERLLQDEPPVLLEDAREAWKKQEYRFLKYWPRITTANGYSYLAGSLRNRGETPPRVSSPLGKVDVLEHFLFYIPFCETFQKGSSQPNQFSNLDHLLQIMTNALAQADQGAPNNVRYIFSSVK